MAYLGWSPISGNQWGNIEDDSTKTDKAGNVNMKNHKDATKWAGEKSSENGGMPLIYKIGKSK